MPPLEPEAPPTEDSNAQDKTLSGPIIGIIYPPPEVRSKFFLFIIPEIPTISFPQTLSTKLQHS